MTVILRIVWYWLKWICQSTPNNFFCGLLDQHFKIGTLKVSTFEASAWWYLAWNISEILLLFAFSVKYYSHISVGTRLPFYPFMLLVMDRRSFLKCWFLSERANGVFSCPNSHNAFMTFRILWSCKHTNKWCIIVPKECLDSSRALTTKQKSIC